MAATQLTADLHPLLTEYVIKKLHKNRLTTVYSFVKVEAEQLIRITNLPAESIVLVKDQLIERFAGQCRNGQTHPTHPTVPLGTGINSIDAILQGGLVPGHIYELCGKSGTGKTLLCMTIAANVVQQRSSVFYIDTKCDFSGRKIQQILEKGQRQLSEQELGHTMARIKVERIFSPELLVQVVEELANGAHQEGDTNLKLLIIDSLPSLWYLFQDSSSSIEPLGLLTKLICSLRKLATQHNVAVLLVNLAVRMVEGMAGSSGIESKRKLCPNGTYPALGRYWESAPGTRLLLELDDDDDQSDSINRSVLVWKSNYLRTGERTIIRMTGAGVR
ncbi:DNA repair protein RAD51 homolog 4 [Anopheles stephensi]|uniref:RecA family profile 1 domain-containing protein n=1 Tax=Anopheles stephensi TaxID=30069 RepID=A0A182YKU3_ANOST|nr:DNA repair protein RAD51 homolog 4 [Anopheles stephensi]